MLDGQGKMLYVGSKVSHRFDDLYRNVVGKVISLEGHWFDGEQMVVVSWFGNKSNGDSAWILDEHHFAESLMVEA